MLIRIVCPEHCAYEGEAAFAVVPSTDGECGILPKHANEICTITDGYVRVCDKEMEPVLVEVMRSWRSPISVASVGW